MSRLTIKGNSVPAINPHFTELFVQIAEGLRPISDIKVVSPYLAGASETVTCMAEFMLRTGCNMGVLWGDKFYFGDVDLMEMYDDSYIDDTGTIVLTHEVSWSTCILCKKDITGVGVDFKTGHVHSGCCTKFLQFQVSGRNVEDLSEYTDDATQAHPGRVYLDSLGISDASHWDNDWEGLRWVLQIANMQYESDCLEDMEMILYTWAQSAGYCDKLGLTLSWDKRNGFWSHEFADGKSIQVTDKCFILSSFTGDDYLLPSTFFDDDCEETDWRPIAFKLVPYLGQEIADATAKDMAFIVDNWNC